MSRNRQQRPGGYPHHGKRHALRLQHANARRAAVHMETVSTLTQYEKEKRQMQSRERAHV